MMVETLGAPPSIWEGDALPSRSDQPSKEASDDVDFEEDFENLHDDMATPKGSSPGKMGHKVWRARKTPSPEKFGGQTSAGSFSTLGLKSKGTR